MRPDDRCGDPGQQDHRDPLRTRQARRTGPHGRQNLGRIPDGGGWRGRGESATNHRSKKDKTAKVGYDYVHSLVDDHSRLAYSEVLPDEQGPTCAAFLRRAIAYFATHGIARIERLMTDNAWAYRWSLRAVCTEAGIRHKFIKPTAPGRTTK